MSDRERVVELGDRNERLRDLLEATEMRIDAALALHKSRDHGGTVAPYCPECSSVSHGCTPWPCPTVKALEEEK